MDKTMEEMPTIISFDSKKLPAIKDYKVGDKVQLVIYAEVQSISKDSMWSDQQTKTLRCSLKVTKVEVEEGDDESTKMAKKGHY